MLKGIQDSDSKKNQLGGYNMKNLNHYILLAELFRYPSDNFIEKINECQRFLEAQYPEAAEKLSIFSSYINNCDQEQAEELYTKTFDVQPLCYLDLGYVIFGEDYKRGAFLLHMQGEQNRIHNDCGSDLPDNICNVLCLMSKSADEKFITELTVEITIPAVKKMIAEFESARVELKMNVLKKLHKAIIQEDLNLGNVYRYTFEALLNILLTDFKAEAELVTSQQETNNTTHHQSFFNKSTVN